METQYSNTLQINKLSKAQYDREVQDGALDSTALYLTPTEDLVIQLNGGTTQGTNKFTYNGSTAKSVNITPSSIGAATTSHTHGNITNNGKLGTASMVVVTDGSKNITTSSTISTTELGYLNNVSSNIQTQLDTKLSTSGGVVSGTLYLTRTTDLNGTSWPALCIGAKTGAHVEFDGNEMQCYSAKNEDGTSPTYTTYYMQLLGGSIDVGASGVDGGGITANLFTVRSDARLKENLRPVVANSILDLPVYKFDYINGNKDQIGCLAQDLQKICPELVTKGDNGYLNVQESKIVYLLLDEVKKLRTELTLLKEQMSNVN